MMFGKKPPGLLLSLVSKQNNLPAQKGGDVFGAGV